MTPIMSIPDAAEIYIKGVHYNYDATWKECLCYLYEHGLTNAQHRQLAHLRAEFATTIYTVKDCLEELTRSLDANEHESARYETWASMKQAKSYRGELVDRAKAIVKVVQA